LTNRRKVIPLLLGPDNTEWRAQITKSCVISCTNFIMLSTRSWFPDTWNYNLSFTFQQDRALKSSSRFCKRVHVPWQNTALSLNNALFCASKCY